MLPRDSSREDGRGEALHVPPTRPSAHVVLRASWAARRPRPRGASAICGPSCAASGGPCRGSGGTQRVAPRYGSACVVAGSGADCGRGTPCRMRDTWQSAPPPASATTQRRHQCHPLTHTLGSPRRPHPQAGKPPAAERPAAAPDLSFAAAGIIKGMTRGLRVTQAFRIRTTGTCQRQRAFP